MTKQEMLRRLPSVDEVLELPDVKELIARFPRQLVVEGVRELIEERRSAILAGDGQKAGSTADSLAAPELVSSLEEKLSERLSPSLKRLINATGVVIHTNLGRSILPEEAIQAIADVASHYSNLEFDLEEGTRGSRHVHIEELLAKITGAEAGMVVNNNAAAVLLALSALAKGKETIVSRGQLVEIGGSFRIPDIMRQSGTVLKEVGTTNKTYTSDYEAAITEDTALLLKVHPSNFRLLGFTQEVSLPELVALGAKHGLPVIEDLGSGVLVDLSGYGVPYEPTVQESVRAGADVVTFSGDKLLGGPQAGLIVCKRKFIDLMKKHPLARAIRIDKLSLAALAATLRQYLDPEKAITSNPTLRMITMPLQELKKQAERLAKGLKGLDSLTVALEDETSRVGGGSLPLAELPTVVVTIASPKFSANALEERLRLSEIPIIVRIKEDQILLDPRTIQDDEEAEIVAAFKRVVGDESL